MTWTRSTCERTDMKRRVMWGVATETNVFYGDTKPVKLTLTDPASIGTKAHAMTWAEEHGGRLHVVEVYS